jgi:hypothetical protein
MQDNNARQLPLFKVQSFGIVAKLGWRPDCQYEIACSTPTVDSRIHLWDIRRMYLPQASFCHHQSKSLNVFRSCSSCCVSSDSIIDFTWRPDADSLISVGRDERLVHAPISTAFKTDQSVSLFSLTDMFVPCTRRNIYLHKRSVLKSHSLKR